jgi:hypothetical protein
VHVDFVTPTTTCLLPKPLEIRLTCAFLASLAACTVHQVINHKKVDTLLMQWEAAIAERERALLQMRRTGREPMRFSGKFGTLLNCCASCGSACCPDPTAACATCCPHHQVAVIPEIEVGVASQLNQRCTSSAQVRQYVHWSP